MTLERAEHLVDLGRHEEALVALSGLGEEGLTARAHCLRALALLRLARTKEAAASAAAARRRWRSR